MHFDLVFSAEAAIDLEQAIIWYEAKRKGLGKRFFVNLEETIERIRKHPDNYGFLVSKFVRRAVLKKFPYAVHYFRNQHIIHILGIYHIKRSNAFKRKRLR